MASSNFALYSDENLLALESVLGVSFEDRGLLMKAISTRAACNEFLEVTVDNERLEFLGDSVLKLLLSDYLFHSESCSEGEMTVLRVALERNQTLGTVPFGRSIKPYLCLGCRERESSGKAERTLLANVLEAVVGAVYLDRGLCGTQCFFEDKIRDELLCVLQSEDVRDYVTPLQEISQKRCGKVPKYFYEQVSGSDHKPLFRAEVYLNGDKVAEAEGSSKKEAKNNAAKKAWFSDHKLG